MIQLLLLLNRLVSHFLRTSDFMRDRVVDMIRMEEETSSFAKSTSLPLSSSPPVSQHIYGPYSTFPIAVAPAFKRCFSIRNGSIFDRDGWLAQALLHHAPAIVAPASTIDLCIPTTDIVPPLFPAAFSASLVSLSKYPRLVDEVAQVPIPAVSSFLLRDPSLPPHTSPCRINISKEWVCLEHTELAIFRSIDIQAQTMVLTLPCVDKHDSECMSSSGSHGEEVEVEESKSSSRPDRMAVIRAAFPLPVQLLYSPTFLSHAYISGDVVGEGSNVMKARKNMKRKAT